jgi:hypothetical protein
VEEIAPHIYQDAGIALVVSRVMRKIDFGIW